MEIDASDPDSSTLEPDEDVIKVDSGDFGDEDESPFTDFDGDSSDFQMTDDDWNDFGDDPFFDESKKR